MGTSRLPGFYKMRIAERLRRVAEQLEVDSDELDGLGESGTLPLANADAMTESAAAVLGLPAEVHAIVHLLVDTQDAMGANLINTMCEGVAPLVERISGGRVRLRILSNLADQRLARATCRIPFDALADFGFSGAEVAHGIADASRFADADPYRACTHNKGVMNGVDAVALATGNDWRAIEARAHALAACDGRDEPRSP